MIARNTLFWFLFFISLENVFAQSVFQKVFKSPDETRGYYADQTMDGGYIIAGRAFIVKTDIDGHMIWSKRYLELEMTCVHQTTDGGFIITGHIYQGSPNYYDGFVMKTDSMGNALWSNSFGETNNEFIYHVEETMDGGYILSGASADSIYNYMLSLVKIDGSGNLLWSKCFMQNLDTKVRQTNDAGYIIAGTTSAGCNIKNGTLVKTDSMGNLLWAKDYCDTYIEDFSFTDVQQTTDGGYIVSGKVSIPHTISSANLLLMRMDSTGDIVWQKAYYGNINGEGVLYSVQQTADGGYAAGGTAGDYGATYCDALLIKTDTLGNLTWCKVYGRTTGVHQARSVRQTSDRGYVLAGHIIPPGANSNDKYFYLIKTDSIGNSGCLLEADAIPTTWQPTIQAISATSRDTIGENFYPIVLNSTSPGAEYEFCSFIASLPEYSSNNFSINVWPNPASGNFIICSNEFLYEAQIKIFNILGEEVYTKDFIGKQKTIDSELRAGIYFIEVTNGNVRWTERLIKQ